MLYDGALPTATTWSGPVAGTVTHSYDDDLRIASDQLSGEPAAIVFQYDDDNLLTGAGAFSLIPHSSCRTRRLEHRDPTDLG